jgi:hypothetical protein
MLRSLAANLRDPICIDHPVLGLFKTIQEITAAALVPVHH